MNAFRHYLMRHRATALWLVVAALLMKVIVPAGFMPAFSGHSITIELCTGFGPQKMMMAVSGMADHHQGKDDGKDGGKAMPCGFGGLSVPSLAAADPLLLAIALAFIVAAAVRAEPRQAAPASAYLRPPLRGPPIPA